MHRTFLDRLVKPFERLPYRVCGIDCERDQSWRGYAFAMLAFSLMYFILRYQHLWPLNPQNLPGVEPDLAFNTAVSFTTNTNRQSYGGESTMSYFSQTVALTRHNFTSAAVGQYRSLIEHARGPAANRRGPRSSIASFWVLL